MRPIERKKRSVTLSMAVTPRDSEAMRRGAEQDQKTLSDYLRSSGLTGMTFVNDRRVSRYAQQELFRSVGSSLGGVARQAWKQMRAEWKPSHAVSPIRSAERQKRSVILSVVVTPRDAEAMRWGAEYEQKTLSDFLRTSVLIGMTFSSDRRVSRHANMEVYRSIGSAIAGITREAWNRWQAERAAKTSKEAHVSGIPELGPQEG